MSLPCKMLAALFAGFGVGWFAYENGRSDQAREDEAAVDAVRAAADEFGPPLKDAVASQLFAQASAEASLSGESVVAEAERICRCEAPTGEFKAVDPLQGRERFKGPEDIA